jgi:secreted PhoX family phosphatase
MNNTLACVLSRTAIALGVAAALTGCDDDDAKNADSGSEVREIVFTLLELPATDKQKASVRASESVTVDGETQPVGFEVLFRTGDMDPVTGETYGLMKDVDGNVAMAEVDGVEIPYVCNGTNGTEGSGTDFSALLNRDGKTWLVTQFECPVGGMYFAEVSQDDSGKLSPVPGTLKFVDQSAEFGGWVHCAGSVTPWETYLGGEEYEPDARRIEEAGAHGYDDDYYTAAVTGYWKDDLESPVRANPYYYGWITEVDIAGGEASYRKRFSMGRFSHELGYVMPDGKTVYLTDDGTNNTLFMFVADTAGELSNGTLYAAVWKQTSAEGAGAASLRWINLGHATDSRIRAAVAERPVFSSMFDTAEPTADNTCPDGFSAVAPDDDDVQCLAVREGMDVPASRLESRRYAAVMGATHEFRKMEGFTYDPVRGRAFLAISEISRGMLDDTDDPENGKNHDTATGNDIRLSPDYCGGIYALDIQGGALDTSGAGIDSDMVAVNMYGILASGQGGTGPEDCSDEVMAQPDNITLMPGSDLLVIAEDGDHANNMMWSLDLESGDFTRILTVPEGAETTSPYFFSVGEFTYLMGVVQHPESTDDKESVTGYLGPIRLN